MERWGKSLIGKESGENEKREIGDSHLEEIFCCGFREMGWWLEENVVKKGFFVVLVF